MQTMSFNTTLVRGCIARDSRETEQSVEEAVRKLTGSRKRRTIENALTREFDIATDALKNRLIHAKLTKDRKRSEFELIVLEGPEDGAYVVSYYHRDRKGTNSASIPVIVTEHTVERLMYRMKTGDMKEVLEYLAPIITYIIIPGQYQMLQDEYKVSRRFVADCYLNETDEKVGRYVVEWRPEQKEFVVITFLADWMKSAPHPYIPDPVYMRDKQ